MCWIKSPHHANTEHLITLAPKPPSGERAHKVIAQSRRRYTRSRQAAEEAVIRQIESGYRTDSA